MSDSFRDRESAFETEFEIGERRKFDARVHRDRNFGHWAANKLGLTGAKAAEYAEAIVALNIENKDDIAMIFKVIHDMHARGITCTMSTARHQLALADDRAHASASAASSTASR